MASPICTALWILLIASLAACQETDSKELARFQGRWKVVKLIGDEDKAKLDYRLEFKGNKLIVSIVADGKEKVAFEGPFKIDPTQKPASFDIDETEAASPAKGIYAFDGETLILRIAKGGEGRPKDLKASTGAAAVLHLERMKKD